MKHILFNLGFDTKARVTCLVLRALNMKMKAGRREQSPYLNKINLHKDHDHRETLYINCYLPPPPDDHKTFEIRQNMYLQQIRFAY